MLHWKCRVNSQRPKVPVNLPPDGYLASKAEYLLVRGKHWTSEVYDEEPFIAVLEACCGDHPHCPWEHYCKYYYDLWNETAPISHAKYSCDAVKKHARQSDVSDWLPQLSSNAASLLEWRELFYKATRENIFTYLETLPTILWLPSTWHERARESMR